MLPLCDMDVYETPKSKWLNLDGKPGKENKKERGQLEIRVSFTVKAGSLMDLSKVGKNKSSTSLANIGGSLLSLGTLDKRKKLKDFTKSFGNKSIFKRSSKSRTSIDNISSSGSSPNMNETNYGRHEFHNQGHDPGIISENEDEFILDNLSQKGSTGSLSFSKENLSTKYRNKSMILNPNIINDEWQQKLTGKKAEKIKAIPPEKQETSDTQFDTTTTDSFLKPDSNNTAAKTVTTSSNFNTSSIEKKRSPSLSMQLSKMAFSNKNKKHDFKVEVSEQSMSRENPESNKAKDIIISETLKKKYGDMSKEVRYRFY